MVTLPVTVWPANLFLSLEYSASYIAASAEVGLAANAVSGVFRLLYLVLAQKRNVNLSLGVAIRRLDCSCRAGVLIHLDPVGRWRSTFLFSRSASH